MTNYLCERCGFETLYRHKFIRHLTRKNICHPILRDTTLVATAQKYRINLPTDSQLTHNDSQTQNFDSQNSNQNQVYRNVASSPNNTKRFLCPKCLMTFSRKNNLIRHQLKYCKNIIKP